MLDEKWIDKNVRVKKDKVVTKLRNKQGGFWKSVIIPTDYYPLYNDEFKVYNRENCINVSDKKTDFADGIINAFNKCDFKIGFCYENSEKLTSILCDMGYKAVQYVGWWFIDSTQIPTFHSWVVVNDNIVLDYADFFYTFFVLNNDNLKKANEEGKDIREEMADFFQYIHEEKISNAKLCFPLGVPSMGCFYVGCPCGADDGKKLWNVMMNKFPNHDSYRMGDEKGTLTQRYIFEKLK